MGNHDIPRSPRWAGLLLMASTASALTLSNFQIITSTGVPISCVLAYNTIIPGCTTNDITEGRTCSPACVDGLRKVQATIYTVCDTVNVEPESVLGQALMGNLVNLLCPSPGTTLTTSRSTKTTSASSSTRSTSTSTSDTALPSKITLTPVASSTALPSSTPSLATDIPTLEPSLGQPPGALPAPPQPTSSAAPPSPPDSSPEVALGGGSPFDTVITGGSSSRFATSLFQACSLALAASLLLVR